jgi:hypothetical protein
MLRFYMPAFIDKEHNVEPLAKRDRWASDRTISEKITTGKSPIWTKIDLIMPPGYENRILRAFFHS